MNMLRAVLRSLIYQARPKVVCFPVPFRVNAQGRKELAGPHPKWPTAQPSAESIVEELQRDDRMLAVCPAVLGAVVFDVDAEFDPNAPGDYLNVDEQLEELKAALGIDMSPVTIRSTLRGGSHIWYRAHPQSSWPSRLALRGKIRVDVKPSGYVIWHETPAYAERLSGLVSGLRDAEPLYLAPLSQPT